MFGVHGGEKVGGGFVLGLLLSAAPMHEQAVGEAAKQAHHAHGFGFADSALVVEVRDVQSLVQPAFNAPGGPVVLQPLRGVQALGRQAGHQRDGFGGVLTQMPAQQGDLLDTGEIHLLWGGCPGAQHATFRLSFIELTFAGQRRCGRARGKNPPAGQ